MGVCIIGWSSVYPGPPDVSITPSCENTVNVTMVPSANGGVPTSIIGIWTQTIIPPSNGVIANMYTLSNAITTMYTGALMSTNCAESVTTSVTVLPPKCKSLCVETEVDLLYQFSSAYTLCVPKEYSIV